MLPVIYGPPCRFSRDIRGVARFKKNCLRQGECMRVCKRIVGLLAITSLFSVGACTQKNESTTAGGTKAIKVGFVLATMNEERYAKDKNYFMEFAKERGVNVEFA